MPANILNSGSPLTTAPSAPLWTAQCDASANLTNNAAPAPLVIPLTGASGPGTVELPSWIQNLDQIESVNITGTMKGKRGDTISLNLKHETYGVLPLLTNHGILGNLTTPYPLPAEVRTFLFGETIPAGYVFASFAGPGTSQFITLPENVNPNNYYYYSNYYQYYQGFSWQTYTYVPEGTPTTISVPAHRYPYTPDYNYDNLPGSALVTGAAPLILIYRGFRYIITSQTGGEPSIVSTKTFTNTVYDNGTSNTTEGYYSTGAPGQTWNDFNGQFEYNYYSENGSFSETLYAAYGAHDWIVTGVTRSATNYTVSLGLSFYIATRVVDTYTVRFLVWPPIVWNVASLAQVTWQAIFPPSATYQFYPPDYADYQALAERSENLSLQSLLWKGMAADGVWTLEYAATSLPPAAAVAGSIGPSTAFSPTVIPAIVRVDNLQLVINFKTNELYQSASIVPTTPSSGVTQAYTQGNMRTNGDDRAFIGILCGIGSSSMGILCGYAVQRIGRNGEIYNVVYSVATCCNINNINSVRIKKSISYFAQNWGDRPFSTKGDAGEAFVAGSTQYRIYPVRGQVGLQVQIAGNKLCFQMMNGYPPLVFIDPTVALITSFTRFSLNS